MGVLRPTPSLVATDLLHPLKLLHHVLSHLWPVLEGQVQQVQQEFRAVTRWESAVSCVFPLWLETQKRDSRKGQ